jgi:hypothetical protein
VSAGVSPERLRWVVYGALGLSMSGWGCNLKACTCTGLPTKLLVRDTPTERPFTDVEMLGEGTEPRVTLRVARWVGLRYRFVVESTGSVALEGQPAAAGATLTMTLDHEVLRGSADPIVEHRDGATVRLIEERAVLSSARVRQEGAPPGLLDEWNRSLRGLEGTTYRQRVTESAGVAWMKSELVGGAKPPEAVQKAVDAALEVQRHFPFRLPSVPVGTGARWRFREQVDINGAKAVQVADMSLKAIDANLAVIGIALRQEASQQEVPHPMVPGAKAVLDQFRGDGEGEITVDRLTAIIVRGRLVNTARLTLTGDVAGQRGTATLVGATVMQAWSTISADGDAGEEAPREAEGAGSVAPLPPPTPTQAAPGRR